MTDIRSRLAREGYEIFELLGKGGMGEVYRARQAALDRPVAIKLLISPDAEAVSRFRREARVQAGLHHEGLVEVYGFSDAPDMPYLVMELLEARTLRQEMATGLEPDEILRILGIVCEALHFVHEKGVVHRDVKPDNIFLLRDGGVKLGDFGIARAELAGSTLTQEDIVIGSLPYLAPERFHGTAADPRSDQYAVGVTAYELFTGSVPFEAIPRRKGDVLPPLLVPGSSIPLPLGPVLERAVAHDVEERFPSMEVMRQALFREVPGETSRGVTTSMSRVAIPGAPRRARPWVLAGGFAVAAVLFALDPGNQFLTRSLPTPAPSAPSPAEDEVARMKIALDQIQNEIAQFRHRYDHQATSYEMVKDPAYWSAVSGTLDRFREELVTALEAPRDPPLELWIALEDRFDGLAHNVTDVIVTCARDALLSGTDLDRDIIPPARQMFRKMESVLQRAWREPSAQSTRKPAHLMIRCFTEAALGRAAEGVNEILLLTNRPLLDVKVAVSIRERTFVLHQGFRNLETFPLASRAQVNVEFLMALRMTTMIGQVDTHLLGHRDPGTLEINDPDLTLSLETHLIVFTHLENLGTSIPPLVSEYESIYRWSMLVATLQLLHPPYRAAHLEDRIQQIVFNYLRAVQVPILVPNVEEELSHRLPGPRKVIQAFVERCEKRHLEIPQKHLLAPALETPR